MLTDRPNKWRACAVGRRYALWSGRWGGPRNEKKANGYAQLVDSPGAGGSCHRPHRAKREPVPRAGLVSLTAESRATGSGTLSPMLLHPHAGFDNAAAPYRHIEAVPLAAAM